MSKRDSQKSCRELLKVDLYRCSQCGLCIAVCPQNIIVFSPEVNFKKEGDYCGLCIMLCPEEAIEKV